MARESKKEWPRTVSQALLDAWKKLRRKGDPELMAEKLQYSRPVIDRALIHGYVSLPELPDKINSFFMERLKEEEKQAAALMGQADKVEKLKQ
jgi:hypothetical protein